MPHRLAAALLAVITLGCDARPADPHMTMRYLALGDSYTIGESVAEHERFPNQLAELLRRRGEPIGQVQIIATTGWTTDELNAGIDRANPRGPFDRVSLLIGVNNQYRGRAVEDFRGQFAALLERAIGFAGGDVRRVFVVSVPDWGVMPFAAGRDREKIAAEIDTYNLACRAACEKRGVKFIDITPISRRAATQPSLGASDGLHPSGEQYRLWAEKIAAEL